MSRAPTFVGDLPLPSRRYASPTLPLLLPLSAAEEGKMRRSKWREIEEIGRARARQPQAEQRDGVLLRGGDEHGCGGDGRFLDPEPARSAGAAAATPAFSAARSSPLPRCCCCHACVAAGLTVSFSLITPTVNDTTAPAKPAEAGPQLKLLVGKRSLRVPYAEAPKDAVDFLIVLLCVLLADADFSLEEFGDSLCPRANPLRW
uniref:Uncharacterized protein n=1 Tax=Oryza meridionalis TaxID=40149 RepID=A0A0E0DN73_9ORYZ